ncbi:hypothetical protein [uncultured Maritalea sp.]|uniref:hypothetical protein n=1 Tax=uncultured Maritalea sp. TaxID=757249 RepID=UPI00262E7C73|nr:hypothetical protein [uncultured Maritalea sp.]
MSDKFQEILQQFMPKTEEKTYGALYQYCTSGQMNEDKAARAFEVFVAWFDAQEEPLAQSYGLLILGGLIDSGQLKVRAQILAFFVERAGLVSDYSVLDDDNRFLHFLSHFAYLAGSCVEHLNDKIDGLNGVVSALVDLYLRAPTALWCGEEMLVANLSEAAFAALLVRLNPEVVMQDADNWDDAAMMRWQDAVVHENHKRQLVMALHGMNVKLARKPAEMFAPIIGAHYAGKFG